MAMVLAGAPRRAALASNIMLDAGAQGAAKDEEPNHLDPHLFPNRSSVVPHPLHNLGALPDVHSSRQHTLACMGRAEA